MKISPEIENANNAFDANKMWLSKVFTLEGFAFFFDREDLELMLQESIED